jgi:sugar lactone lactonase YvrE
MRSIPRLLALLLAVVVAYLLFAPVPIDPAPWTPTPNAGFTGAFAANSLLTGADSIPLPGGGPEDLTLGPDSALYTGLVDGRIVRIDRATGEVRIIADTRGRPLGMRFDSAGTLIVADGLKGILAVGRDGAVRVLVPMGGDARLHFPDALDIAPDGAIWFSDATQRWGTPTGGVMDFWESRPTGRLLRHDPTTGATRIVLDSVDFANGVAVGPGGEWLLLNETMAGRIIRYWISGPRAGSRETFLEGLPGLPDNLGYDGRGLFWVALYAPRTAELTRIRALSPWLRKVIYRIPERLRLSKADRYGTILGVDTSGRVRYNVQDPTGRYHSTTTAVAVHDTLYVGSLSREVIARVRLPAPR